MGLETDITDIQSLNQNWPPVSDPRAQGADHIRNIKKAIQLTFPNLKQCLLNDAQFTALGTLIGDGSGTFTINGKLTVSDTLTVKETLLVPTVTDWTTQQAVGAKDAEGRYLKPGDADGRYVSSTVGGGDAYNIQQITLNNVTNQISAQTRDGVWHFVQPAGDYATNHALNTEITNRANADTNLQNQINNCVQKTGDTMTGTLFQNLGTGAAVIASGLSGPVSAGQSPWTPQFVSQAAGDGQLKAVFCARDLVGNYPYFSWQLTEQNGTWHELQFRSDNRLYTDSGNKFALVSELPFIDQNLRVQVFDAIASDATFVRIPQAFRTLVGVTAQQHSSGSEGIRPIRVETNVFRGDGFNVSIWSGGGNIQYTFVAYGYF